MTLGLDRWRCKIDGDVVRTAGVDWGRPLEILHRHKNRLVLRRKGHMTWSSIGQQAYAETLYMLVEVKRGMARVIEEAEPGRKYRPAVADLIKKCGGMAVRQGARATQLAEQAPPVPVSPPIAKPPPPKPKKEHPNLAIMEDLVKRRVFSSLTQGPNGQREPEYVLHVAWSAAFDPDDDGRGHMFRRGEVTANLGIDGIMEPFTNAEMQDITFAAKMAASKCLRERLYKKRRNA